MRPRLPELLSPEPGQGQGLQGLEPTTCFLGEGWSPRPSCADPVEWNVNSAGVPEAEMLWGDAALGSGDPVLAHLTLGRKGRRVRSLPPTLPAARDLISLQWAPATRPLQVLPLAAQAAVSSDLFRPCLCPYHKALFLVMRGLAPLGFQISSYLSSPLTGTHGA